MLSGPIKTHPDTDVQQQTGPAAALPIGLGAAENHAKSTIATAASASISSYSGVSLCRAKTIPPKFTPEPPHTVQFVKLSAPSCRLTVPCRYNTLVPISGRSS